MKTYFEEREISCIERINEIVAELPYFTQEFFIGVENRTSPLTRLNYAYDLRVFFDFLTKKMFRNKKVLEVGGITSSNVARKLGVRSWACVDPCKISGETNTNSYKTSKVLFRQSQSHNH